MVAAAVEVVDQEHLGRLRANRGSAGYAVPDEADTDALTSVILWCERFSVSFGAAQLHPLI